MSKPASAAHPVAERRLALGWSQETLATAAGVPRSSLSAIEAGRLTPSVSAALAVARALGCSVEELFGSGHAAPAAHSPEWAWAPFGDNSRFWEAEVGGRRLLYPVEGLPGAVSAHDGVFRGGVARDSRRHDPSRTLVVACCDPAVALLASEYQAASGFRLLAFARGGGAALECLRRGAVHVAGLHRSTNRHAGRNEATVREVLGPGHHLLRYAEWQEGLALAAGDASRNARQRAARVRRWAMREPGSAARECLDELLETPRPARHTVTSHAAVAEAVRSGWAEAGVCVRLSAEDAGLPFLPLRTEFLDLCFPATLTQDPRIQALLRLVRSRSYRALMDDLPGYNARQTGELRSV